MTVSSKAKQKRKKRNAKLSAQWQKQAAWLIKTITKLHESPTGHGLGWTKGMVKHYAKDFYALRLNTPPPCQKVASEHDETLQSILDCYE